MLFASFIKRKLINLYDILWIKWSHKNEKKKFLDQRRINIYQNILLSPEQKKKIKSLYKNYYGKNVPYTWHRHFTAFTGKFDYRYFPELLYIPEFEHFENMEKEYCKVMSDKNMLAIIAKGIGVKTPKTLCSCASGLYRDQNYKNISHSDFIELFANIGECFIKPTIGSSSGQKCFLVSVGGG